MPQRYTMSQAARLIGISRRALYDWIEDAGIRTGHLPGDARTRTLTKDQIDKLAAAHGKRLEDERLEQQVMALSARLEALEAWQEEAEAKIRTLEGQRTLADDLADTVKRPAVPRPAPASSASARAWHPPAPVRSLVARWVAEEHGGVLNTIRRWEDLPLDATEALRFTDAKMAAEAHRHNFKRLHQCAVSGCPCHHILPAE